MCSCALVVDLLAFWMFAMCMWAYVLTNVYLVCCHCKSKEFQLFNFYLQLKIRHTQFPIMPIDDDNLFRWIKLLMRFGVRTRFAHWWQIYTCICWGEWVCFDLKRMCIHSSESLVPTTIIAAYFWLSISSFNNAHSLLCLDILDRECIIKSQCII